MTGTGAAVCTSEASEARWRRKVYRLAQSESGGVVSVLSDQEFAIRYDLSMPGDSTLYEKAAAHHVEDALGHGAIFEAKQASDEEHTQTLWEAIRTNRKAVGWSVLISMSIVMEGYDINLMSNFFGYPAFQKKFGNWYGEDVGWQISVPWQTGLSMGSTVGTVFGMFCSLA